MQTSQQYAEITQLGSGVTLQPQTCIQKQTAPLSMLEK